MRQVDRTPLVDNKGKEKRGNYIKLPLTINLDVYFDNQIIP